MGTILSKEEFSTYKKSEISDSALRFVVICYLVLPMVNGYFIYLHNAKTLYWFLDGLVNCVIPAIVIFLFLKRYKWNEIGFQWPNKIEEWFNFIGITIGISILIPVLFSFVVNRIIIAPKSDLLVLYKSSFRDLLNWVIPRPFLIVYMSISAAFFEEVFYKGVLPKIISFHFKSKPLVVLLSCMIFSVMHWEQGFSGTINAFIYCYGTFLLYLHVKNLLPFIIGHFLIDLINYTFYL